MYNEYEIREFLGMPLSDALPRLYSNSIICRIYQNFIAPLVERHPSLLAELAKTQLTGNKKTPKKNEKVELLKMILKDTELCTEFLALMPAPVNVAITRLAWHGACTLETLEALVGTPVADLNPEEGRRAYEPLLMREAFDLFFSMRRGGNMYYWGRTFAKNDFNVHLPNALRKAFKKCIPPPPEYVLQPLDEPPSGTMRYLADKAMGDMKAAAEFIEQGHAKYTRNEQISKVSVRKFQEVIKGTEFFKPGSVGDYDQLRTRMLLEIISFSGQAFRKTLCTSTSADPFKELPGKLSPVLLEAELLGHIRPGSLSTIYQPGVAARLAKVMSEMPFGKWVSARNILLYFKYRDELPSVYAEPAAKPHYSYGAYGSTTPDEAFNQRFAMISEPLLKGFAFLLAALGMAEIAYMTPENQQPFMPFSGLEALRLTPLGEFVLGKRTNLDVEVGSVPRSEILLDSNRLMASCRNLDSMTELALKQFMDRITQSRFRMTHKSLLGGCSSRKALEDRIALFRRVIAAEPPPIWEQFFTQTLNRIAPLQRDGELLVFKLDTDEETRRLFSTDPVLRQHCLKVEGYRIAIRHQDIKTVCKQLEKAGCLCPPATLLEPQV